MNCIQTTRDSVETAMTLKLFKSRDKAISKHIFNSKLVSFPLSKCKSSLSNFNPERLQPTAAKAYPLSEEGGRPRGEDDIKSVKYYQKLIRDKSDIPPIWIMKKNAKKNGKEKNKFILLDGAHRIVASYIENQKYIPAFLII